MHGKDIIEPAVEAVRPKGEAVDEINQLDGNADPVRDRADAALDDGLNMQQTADVEKIFIATFEAKRGSPCGKHESRQPGRVR